jgi:hypothetical protein
MSSAYLTSKNMMMIDRLLTEHREYPRCRDRETEKARFLVGRFQGGVKAEGDLRKLLNAHICESKEGDTSRWEVGRASVRRIVGSLFGFRVPVRKPSQIIAKALAPRPSRNEVQRQFDNDTDGRQRRENEVKSRNRMH